LTGPPELPAPWTARLSAYCATRQTIGESGAAVYRLHAAGAPTLFLKSEPAGPFCELPGEADRMRWLGAQGIPCPAVLDATQYAGIEWLLMTALPGRDMASSPELPAEVIAFLLADALRSLHALDPSGCPFDHCLEYRLALAGRRLAAGLQDERGFSPKRTAAEEFTRLAASKPEHEDLVVAHGDACLPNFVADAGRFTGFIDCGRLGVADRHQDLALACRSLDRNLGPDYEDLFLARYGVEPDRDRLAFYRLLDEYF
jgi:aminoglycoside 3'-phosphotransferase II